MTAVLLVVTFLAVLAALGRATVPAADRTPVRQVSAAGVARDVRRGARALTASSPHLGELAASAPARRG